MISTIRETEGDGDALLDRVLEEDPSAWGLSEQRLKEWGVEPCRDLGEVPSRQREQQTERTHSERLLKTRLTLPFRSPSLLLICRTTSLLLCCEETRGLGSGSSPQGFHRRGKAGSFYCIYSHELIYPTVALRSWCLKAMVSWLQSLCSFHHALWSEPYAFRLMSFLPS